MVDATDHFLYALDHTTYARRHYLSQLLREQTGSVVQYGLLKGYVFGVSLWAEAAVGTYLLGTYEAQICAILDGLKSPRKVLIDIGAADGLYGVGLVAVGAFCRSLCFEANERFRDNLRQAAAAAGVSAQISIHGTAQLDTIQRAVVESGVDPANAVVICDIEGGEFELFDEALLNFLSGAHVIIETHDFLYKGELSPASALADLKQRASAHFNVHEVKDGMRYLRDVPLLEGWSDADTWTMCMEGRKRMMTWLYLTPKSEPPLTDEAVDAIIYRYQKQMFA